MTDDIVMQRLAIRFAKEAQAATENPGEAMGVLLDAVGLVYACHFPISRAPELFNVLGRDLGRRLVERFGGDADRPKGPRLQ